MRTAHFVRVTLRPCNRPNLLRLKYSLHANKNLKRVNISNFSLSNSKHAWFACDDLHTNFPFQCAHAIHILSVTPPHPFASTNNNSSNPKRKAISEQLDSHCGRTCKPRARWPSHVIAHYGTRTYIFVVDVVVVSGCAIPHTREQYNGWIVCYDVIPSNDLWTTRLIQKTTFAASSATALSHVCLVEPRWRATTSPWRDIHSARASSLSDKHLCTQHIDFPHNTLRQKHHSIKTTLDGLNQTQKWSIHCWHQHAYKMYTL